MTIAHSALSLGVLDFEGTMDMAADLGPRVEAAGYARYWFAEHSPQATPLLPTALLLGLTQSLRVGTAGVLIGFRNVYQVAQDFRLLHGTFPDRVDAGFSGGRPGSVIEKTAMRDGLDPDLAPGELQDRAATLVGLLRDTLPVGHRWHGVPQVSKGASAEPWSLGTSSRGAVFAAELGVPYAHSLFHRQSQDTHDAAEEYRRRFAGPPTSRRFALAIAGVCGATDEVASRLVTQHTNDFVTPTLVGGVERCAEAIARLRERWRMDDLVILDVCRTFEDKAASYELFARAARMASSG